MKYSVGVFLGLAIFTITTARQFADTDRDFEKCKEGSELIAAPQCPDVDPEQPVYFSFPSDCQQYYQCSNGIARCIKCAPGTVWDQENLICNHPAAVNCTAVPTTTPKPSGSNEPPENVICDKEGAGLFSHPNNCTLFIICDPGRLPCIIECPEGTCFNNETNTCEYPNNVKILKNDGRTAQHKTYQYAIQGKFSNYRNVKRDNFAEAVQFVASTLIKKQLEYTSNDNCDMLNFYVRHA